MAVTPVAGWVESMALSMAEYSAVCLVDRMVAMWAVWMVARKRAEEKGEIN